jgi:hypothetical protein
MDSSMHSPARVEFSVVLLLRGADAFFALIEEGGGLPQVTIATGGRTAQLIAQAIEARWQIKALVLDLALRADASSQLAFVRAVECRSDPQLVPVQTEALSGSGLSEHEYSLLQKILAGEHPRIFSNFDWLDEALDWIHTATHRKVDPRGFEQWTIGDGFMLCRFRLDHGKDIWLKATGVPNKHEFGIASFLALHCSRYVPEVIAISQDWNAWITQDAGLPLSPDSPSELFVRAAKTFSSFQVDMIPLAERLLTLQAADHRLPVLRKGVGDVMDFLAGAMERQSSTKAPPVPESRLRELGHIIRDACDVLSTFGIPDTLLHNDLSLGNILHRGECCVFNDWSEAAVGNPFLALARFCLLSPASRSQIEEIYCDIWSELADERAIAKGLAISPLLAIYAYLYGRGNWLKEATPLPHHFESYARSLARHIDRTSREPELLRGIYS